MSIEKWTTFWRNHEGAGYHAVDRDIVRSLAASAATLCRLPGEAYCFPSRWKRSRQASSDAHSRCDLKNAKIIFAVLNPTVGYNDYVDNEKPEFHDLLKRNRLQENVNGCFAVDNNSPAPSWSGYYRSIFRSAVECATDVSKAPEAEVWETLRRILAIMELVPYYSQNASMLLQNDRYASLPSVKCAQEAMGEVRGRCDTIVICRWERGHERWLMPAGTYISSATRRGLSPAAKWEICKQLVKHLCSRAV